MSVDATLQYMNNLLDTSLFRNGGECSKGTAYVTGHVFVDKANKKIWYSRGAKSDDSGCYFAGYFGAKASDIDAESISTKVIDGDGPVIEVNCLNLQAKSGKVPKVESLGCIQYWKGQYIGGNGSLLGKSLDPSLLHMLDLTHAEFISKSDNLHILPKNDDDAMVRFVRAFKHLVIAVRALPGGDPRDPFSGG